MPKPQFNCCDQTTDYDDSICCAKCNKRYHSKCLQLQVDLNTNIDVDWICPSCLPRISRGNNEDIPVRNKNTSTGSERNISKRSNKRVAVSSPERTTQQNDIREIVSDIVKAEIKDMLTQINLTIKTTINTELKTLREEILDMKDSIKFINSQYEDFLKEHNANKAEFKDIKERNNKLESNIDKLTARLKDVEQRSRSNNLELQCVPESKTENIVKIVEQLGKVIGVEIKRDNIFNATRVAKINRHSTRPRSIIVQFNSPLTRDSVLAAVIKYNKSNSNNKLNTSHLGIGTNGDKKPIYVMEHLSPENKALHAATRLKAKNMGELFDDRYNVYRRDRETSKLRTKNDGGGVLIAVKKTINSSRVRCWESDCEDLWVVVNLSHMNSIRRIAFCGVYLPPPVNRRLLERFLGNCNRVFEQHDKFKCIIGDFNLSSIAWNVSLDASPLVCNNSATAQILLDFVLQNGLTQCNSVLNNRRKILDLVLADLPECSVSYCYNTISNVEQLHPPLEINIPNMKRDILTTKTTYDRYNFYRADYDSINQYISGIDWKELLKLDDVDEMVRLFYEVLRTAISNHVPLKKTKSNRYPSWINRDIRRRIKEKHKLLKRFKKYNNAMDEVELRLLSDRCHKITHDAYAKYNSELEKQILRNPKAFWTFLNSKRANSNAYPATMNNGIKSSTSGDEICNMFLNHFNFASVHSSASDNFDSTNFLRNISYLGESDNFTRIIVNQNNILEQLKNLNISKGAGPDNIPPVFLQKTAKYLALPLHLIYNASLVSGTFPAIWKQARVVPVFKGGDEKDIRNYRPISILSIFAKVFESLVCPLVRLHFNRYISEHQHGFWPGRSTTTNLVTFTSSLCEAIDSQKQVDVIYTDFKKAFDSVPHRILVKKLSCYGFSGPLLQWLSSYLHNRSFYVVMNGFSSLSSKITSGIPQGSHLGPVLFNLFINDIVLCFKHSTPYLYADDLKFVRVICSLRDSVLLQDDIDRVSNWCESNGMQLNLDKCLHIKFTRKRDNISTQYTLNGEKLREVESVKDLGVILDRKLTYLDHLNIVINKASNMILNSN
ncbi:unnamed protein product [Euphydryas editha]|uniref:Reverse transcriptase domain-containing protein n=1 Tax=Euphydryas editha TaxID=104508 RepID=A0AAU9TYQ0_EUPED|nr:unnamed protein product [Euphydryas editha]